MHTSLLVSYRHSKVMIDGGEGWEGTFHAPRTGNYVVAKRGRMWNTGRFLNPRGSLSMQSDPFLEVFYKSGRGAVWLARLTGGQKVAGSNPVGPTLQL
jgi:hypothetical protein